MRDDGPPKRLNERTGRHFCVRCLAEVPAESYQRNDHICDACAAGDEYPAAAPAPRAAPKKGKGQRAKGR
jgi:hypothetical protein